MLGRAYGAQYGIQEVHDQPFVGVERWLVGIRLYPQWVPKTPSTIPKGLHLLAQRWPDSERDPGYAHFSSTNLEGVEYQRLTKWMQLSRSCDFAPISPRVGLMEQQRAGPERWGAHVCGLLAPEHRVRLWSVRRGRRTPHAGARALPTHLIIGFQCLRRIRRWSTRLV